MVERFVWFTESSRSGETCKFALKSKEIFMRRDYDEIRGLLRELGEILDEMDEEEK